jgi:hypothetical protein
MTFGAKTKILALLLSASFHLSAQTITLHLVQDANSKMPTGTRVEAKDDSGRIYHGHLITRHARRLLRNGSMLIVFDEPVKPITTDPEGRFRGGNKVRLLKIGGSLAVAKIADDSVDATIGAGRARYVAAAAAIIFLLFMKGEDAKLHSGDAIQAAVGR